jgi:hypothetical protein
MMIAAGAELALSIITANIPQIVISSIVLLGSAVMAGFEGKLVTDQLNAQKYQPELLDG